MGAIKKNDEAFYGSLLAPYLAADDTFFVISSDFCHWLVERQFFLYENKLTPVLSRGTRFDYTFYYPEPAPSEKNGIRLSRMSAPSSSYAIHESISRLDHEAMDILAISSSTAAEAHSTFASYLARTKNTICGRHPIGVLFGALATLEKDKDIKPTLKWVRYEQSSPCRSIRDSSVSYASAYVRF